MDTPSLSALQENPLQNASPAHFAFNYMAISSLYREHMVPLLAKKTPSELAHAIDDTLANVDLADRKFAEVGKRDNPYYLVMASQINELPARLKLLSDYRKILESNKDHVRAPAISLIAEVESTCYLIRYLIDNVPAQ